MSNQAYKDMLDKTDGNHVFLLIDARNDFNECNRQAMIFIVRKDWPIGSKFVLNCYFQTLLWTCESISTIYSPFCLLYVKLCENTQCMHSSM